MWRLILLILCLSTTETVLGLICYGTDLDKLSNMDQTLDLNHEIADCDDLIKQAIPDVSNISSITPQCFTTLIKGKIFTMEVKGCLPKDSCSETETTLKRMSIFKDTEVECHQCEGELCNSSSVIKHLSSLFLLLLASVVLTF